MKEQPRELDLCGVTKGLHCWNLVPKGRNDIIDAFLDSHKRTALHSGYLQHTDPVRTYRMTRDNWREVVLQIIRVKAQKALKVTTSTLNCIWEPAVLQCSSYMELSHYQPSKQARLRGGSSRSLRNIFIVLGIIMKS